MESSLVKNLVREPLVHFLLLGALIFAAFKFISSETSQPGKILITQGRIESLATAFSRTWRRPPTASENWSEMSKVRSPKADHVSVPTLAEVNTVSVESCASKCVLAVALR